MEVGCSGLWFVDYLVILRDFHMTSLQRILIESLILCWAVFFAGEGAAQAFHTSLISIDSTLEICDVRFLDQLYNIAIFF